METREKKKKDSFCGVVLGICRSEYTHALINELQGRSRKSGYRAWGEKSKRKAERKGKGFQIKKLMNKQTEK
jgi:hypothetical protein